MDDYEASQEARLSAAESAVQKGLERVRAEQAAVQRAVDDLSAARRQIDVESGGDLASKLRQGGLPKQMALAGVLLFSVRSIIDTVASVTDPSMLSIALIQGAIALACAAFLFFV